MSDLCSNNEEFSNNDENSSFFNFKCLITLTFHDTSCARYFHAKKEAKEKGKRKSTVYIVVYVYMYISLYARAYVCKRVFCNREWLHFASVISS